MNKSDLINVLLCTNLFNNFKYEELSSAFNENNYIIKSYIKNSIIYIQNQECNTLDFILNGTISIQKIDVSGNVLTINEFSKGDIIGENLLFACNKVYPMTILSKNNCTILHIDKELILELCQRNKYFLTSFLQSISNKTIILTKKINSIALKSIRECIIEFLKYEHALQKSNKIKLNMTKKELAERLGVQRTSLSRELNKMKKEGLVDYDKDHIVIKNLF